MSLAPRNAVPWREQLARSLQVAAALPEPPVEGVGTRVGVPLSRSGGSQPTSGSWVRTTLPGTPAMTAWSG